MIKVHIRSGVLGEGHVATSEFPWHPNLTARRFANILRDRLPTGAPIEAVCNGERLGEEGYDELLRDEDELILSAATMAGIDVAALLIYALLSAAVSVGISYALAALNPQPRSPDTPQDRGDETSATYSWSGITTNRGQGFTVPVIYGTHGVGGQVIYTDVDGVVGSSAIGPGIVDDRLMITLALSEGPIARIGGTAAREANFLGQIEGPQGSFPSQGPIPPSIRVNETLLANTNMAVTAWKITTGSWLQSGGSVTIPSFQTGDTLYAWNTLLSVLALIVPANGQPRIVRIENPGSSNPTLFLDRDVPEWTAAAPACWIFQEPGSGLNNTWPAARFFSIIQETLEPSTPGAMAFLRDGSMNQTPMPGSPGPFRGVAVTFQPNGQLNAFAETRTFTYNTGDPISGVTFVISAPAGIYQQDPQGNVTSFEVGVTVRWRFQGELSWRAFDGPQSDFIVGATATSGPQLWTFAFYVNEPITGNIEVNLRRDTGSGGTSTVSNLLWRNVVFSSPNAFSYPGTACLGLSLQANARWDGGLPNFNIECDGVMVRIWDSTLGWSDRTFDVPSAPYDWHTYPPGRNPAWILLDYLLAEWGLGHYLKESDIDLPAFAAFAVYCDLDPNPSNPWLEPRYTCDLVLDRSRPAWEWVLAVCATGRAAPVFINNKLSVVYEYSAAHAQGSINVPAKTAVQLFSSGNIEDMSVTWLPRASRPTVYIYQFLNEETEWRQDSMPLEDEEATFNDQSELFPDQYRPAAVQAYGQTRPSQIYRDSRYRHQVNKLITRKIDFKTGRWALIGTVGDLIEVETEVMRPFPSTGYLSDVPSNGVILVGGSAVSSVTVDHANLPAVGQIKMRDPDGAPITTTWTSFTSTVIEGRDCAVLLLAAPVTVDAGCICIFGTVDKLTETYQIVALTLNQDLTRTVTALEWAPAVHDDIDPGDWEDGASGDFATEPAATPVEPRIESKDIAIVALDSGKHRIDFARLPARRGVTARVYTRTDSKKEWLLVGETSGDSIAFDQFTPHTTNEVSVTFERFDGHAVVPQQGTVATITVPEFTQALTPTISNLVATEIGDGLDWDEITVLGLSHYEVRAGTNWVGARVVAKVKDNMVRWTAPPTESQLMVVAHGKDGSQGNPTLIANQGWSPEGSRAYINKDDIADGLLGTHSDTRIDAGLEFLELGEDAFSGSYVMPEQDAGFVGPFLWRLAIDIHEYDAATVDGVLDLVASGEASWRTVDGREASPGLPGVDFSRSVDDTSGEVVDSFDDELVHGQIGEAGSHTRVLVESRYFDGVWTSYGVHTDGVRTAQKIQFRITLDRETLTHEAQVHELIVSAHL
jgi:hypothetical protein